MGTLCSFVGLLDRFDKDVLVEQVSSRGKLWLLTGNFVLQRCQEMLVRLLQFVDGLGQVCGDRVEVLRLPLLRLYSERGVETSSLVLEGHREFC